MLSEKRKGSDLWAVLVHGGVRGFFMKGYEGAAHHFACTFLAARLRSCQIHDKFFNCSWRGQLLSSCYSQLVVLSHC